MEKEKPINGYEKYSEWFKTIEKMCDETHFIGTLSNQDNAYYPDYQHYKLDNGLHVYKKGEDIIISDEEIKEPSTSRCMKKSETVRKFISIETGESAASISYGPEGTNASGIGPGKDYSFLPSNIQLPLMHNSQNQYEITGDLPIDMRELLSEAMDRAEEEKTRKMYEKTIELYDGISMIVELNKLKESYYDEYGYPRDSRNIDDESAEGLTESEKADLDEMNTDRQNDEEMFSRAEDFTPDELEQMPIEDLEQMLKSTAIKNDEKRKELEGLKKKQLILQIKKAMEEGKELDSRIAEARTNSLENR